MHGGQAEGYATGYAGGHAAGAESAWLLIVVVLVWAAVIVLVTAWGMASRRQRPPQRADHRTRNRPAHRPAHRPVAGPRLRSAITVAELQRRLAAEAAQPPPPVRNIQVIPRTTRRTPSPLDQQLDRDTRPLTPIDQLHLDQKSATRTTT